MKIKRSEKIIKRGDVTVAKDEAYLDWGAGTFGNLLLKFDKALAELSDDAQSTGVAKRHPDDSADEVIGKIVASLKAEKKLNNQLYNKLLKLHRILHVMRVDVIATMGKLVARNDAIEDKLEEFK